jgi:hypothetical protein
VQTYNIQLPDAHAAKCGAAIDLGDETLPVKDKEAENQDVMIEYINNNDERSWSDSINTEEAES